MSEAKPLASLSSSLLARKGHARPAMRPQAMIIDRDPAQSLEDLGWNDMGEEAEEAHRAHITTASTLTPMSSNSPAHVQQEELAQAFEAEAETFTDEVEELVPTVAPFLVKPSAVTVEDVAPLAFQHAPPPSQPAFEPAPRSEAPISGRAAPGSKGKSAFTLRLDPERHLRLRVHCAVTHRSAQQVVTEALEEFLARQTTLNPLSQPASAA
jgi:hypothetical protein